MWKTNKKNTATDCAVWCWGIKRYHEGPAAIGAFSLDKSALEPRMLRLPEDLDQPDGGPDEKSCKRKKTIGTKITYINVCARLNCPHER